MTLSGPLSAACPGLQKLQLQPIHHGCLFIFPDRNTPKCPFSCLTSPNMHMFVQSLDTQEILVADRAVHEPMETPTSYDLPLGDLRNNIVETMDSNSKCVKIEEREDDINCSPNFQKVLQESKDRISSLPNKVLCHILSFLPTKYAVGTCILSTRWMYLWASLPNLDFDDELLLCKEKIFRYSIREMRVSFTRFVDRVLLLRNVSCIHRFRLKCGPNCDHSHVNAWICTALRRKVQELDLCISTEDSKLLPHSLFNCGTLVFLKLCSIFVLKVPASVSLPRLKTLHLNSIGFMDNDSIQTLFSGCTVLEELLIEECGLKNIRLFNISAPALKHLTLECAFFGEHSTEFCEYKIVIDAPSLKYLRLIDYVAEGYLVNNLHSLIEAQVHVDLSTEKLDERSYCYGKNVLDLIRGISSVKFLHLSGDCMEALKLYCCELPMLHNVTHLELDVNKHIGWEILPDLLNSSPNLVALCLQLGLVDYGGEFFRGSHKQVPYCLFFRLKTIKICAFKGQKYQLKLVKYLLKNAKVLHKLIIGTHLIKEEELKVSKQLLAFPRGSTICKVVIS